MRYWKLVSISELVEDVCLASNEEEAIEVLSRNDRHLPSERAAEVLRACITGGDLQLIPICGAGDRVTRVACYACGKPNDDASVGTVIAIGDEVYEHEPSARGRDILEPVLVEWDSGVRTVEEALDLRAIKTAA